MGARVGVHPKLEFYWESMQINTITGPSPPTTQIWDERSRFSEDGIARPCHEIHPKEVLGVAAKNARPPNWGGLNV